MTDLDAQSDEESDAEREARYPYPLPKKGDHVFGKSADEERLSLEKEFSGSSTYLQGYRWAADVLFRSLQRTGAEPQIDQDAGVIVGPMDLSHWMLYPIYFLYRQALELSLKAFLVAQKGGEGKLTTADKNEIYCSHKLSSLWDDARPWVVSVLKGRIPEALDAFEVLVQEISNYDPNAEAGRYAQQWVRGKPKQLKDSLSEFRPIDLRLMHDTCEKMLSFVTWVWSIDEDEERRKYEDDALREFDPEF